MTGRFTPRRGARRALPVRIEPNPDPELVMELERSTGWRQHAETIRRFSVDPEGHFLARDEHDDVLGTASCLTYGDALAFISGMIVRESHRRRGIGRALLDRCVRHAMSRGAAVVALDASEAGAPLYRQEGFRIVGTTRRWVLPEGAAPVEPAARASAAIYPWSACEIMDILRYDTPRFGAPRARLLAEVLAAFPERAFVAFDRGSGDVVGHVMGQERYVGPLVADEPDVAAALLHATLAAGTPPAANLPPHQRDAEDLFQRAGFEPIDLACTRMTRGGPLPGLPHTVFALAGWAFG